MNIPPFLYPTGSLQSCCHLLPLLLEVWFQCCSCLALPAGSSVQPQKLVRALYYLDLLLPGTTWGSKRENLITITIYEWSHTDLIKQIKDCMSLIFLQRCGTRFVRKLVEHTYELCTIILQIISKVMSQLFLW